MKHFLFVLFSTLASISVCAQTSIKVSEPGSLPSLICSSDKYSITDLTVEGTLNGTDILFLREMAGADAEGHQTQGQLSRLNLAHARIVSGGAPYFSGTAAPPEGFSHRAAEIAQLMGTGWNLGNSLEVPVASINAETQWNNPRVRQQLIDSVKAAGFKSIRIPVSWYVHASGGDGTAVDADWMARIKEVVDYCIKDDLWVVINCHYDDNWLQTKGFTDLTEANIEKVAKMQATLWTQIANYFKAYDEHVLFAGTNEPMMNSGVGASVKAQQALDRYLQAFVDAVRATGENNRWRTLIVQSLEADIHNAMEYTWSMPVDDTPDRLMLETHCYMPQLFSLFAKDQTWGKNYYYWGSGNHLSASSRNTPYDKEYDLIDIYLDRLYSKFVRHGIPVIIGEYAACWRTVGTGESQELHDQSIKEWNRYLMLAMLRHHMTPFYWDPGGKKSATSGSMALMYRSRGFVYDTCAIEGIRAARAACPTPDPLPSMDPRAFFTSDGVVGRYMFANCKSLRQVTLPRETALIGAHAFDDCTALQRIDLGQNTWNVSAKAFEGCQALHTVVLPSGLKHIDSLAFSGCHALTQVISPASDAPQCVDGAFPENLSQCTLFVAANAKDRYQTADVWKNFGKLAVLDATAASTDLDITLEKGQRMSDVLQETNTYSYDGDKMTMNPSRYGITSLTVRGELDGSDLCLLSEMAGVDRYGNSTEGKLTKLDLTCSSIVSGGSAFWVTTDGLRYFSTDNSFPSYAFTHNKLSSISLPANSSVIGSNALSYCPALTTVVLPGGLTVIGDSAFESLPETVVDIPETVNSIGSLAFSSAKMNKLILRGEPKIGSQAFRICTSLKTILCCSSIPPQASDDAFRWVTKDNVELVVPKGALEAYRTAPVWKDFNHIREMTEADGIAPVRFGEKNKPLIYDLSGRRALKSVNGMTIWVMPDGTVRKTVMKNR